MALDRVIIDDSAINRWMPTMIIVGTQVGLEYGPSRKDIGVHLSWRLWFSKDIPETVVNILQPKLIFSLNVGHRHLRVIYWYALARIYNYLMLFGSFFPKNWPSTILKFPNKEIIPVFEAIVGLHFITLNLLKVDIQLCYRRQPTIRFFLINIL